MPETLRERNFEPFFTTKANGSGTGIGLALSSSIVQSLGGSLTLAPDRGNGACFVVHLPRSEGTVDESAPEPDESRFPAMGSLSVLVVDDDVRAGLAEMLTLQGHHTVCTDNIHQAMEQVKSTWYEIVLGDIRMPDGDGIEFAERIRTEHLHPVSRFAFITGDQFGPRAAPYLGQSYLAYLTKPFSDQELRHLIARLIA